MCDAGRKLWFLLPPHEPNPPVMSPCAYQKADLALSTLECEQQAGVCSDRQIGRQADRQAGRQTDRQTDRQTGRQAESQPASEPVSQ